MNPRLAIARRRILACGHKFKEQNKRNMFAMMASKQEISREKRDYENRSLENKDLERGRYVFAKMEPRKLPGGNPLFTVLVKLNRLFHIPFCTNFYDGRVFCHGGGGIQPYPTSLGREVLVKLLTIDTTDSIVQGSGSHCQLVFVRCSCGSVCDCVCGYDCVCISA